MPAHRPGQWTYAEEVVVPADRAGAARGSPHSGWQPASKRDPVPTERLPATTVRGSARTAHGDAAAYGCDPPQRGDVRM